MAENNFKRQTNEYQDRRPKKQRDDRRPTQNTTMRDKMSAVLGSRSQNQSNNQQYTRPMISVNNFKEDGSDHINISPMGSTDLGVALNHRSPVSFTHSVFGSFCSMEAFWHFIQSEEQDDRLRTMRHKALNNFQKKLTRRLVTNFRAIIMDSNYQRVMQNPRIAKAMEESSLPFECYYRNTAGIRQRPVYAGWLISGFEEIRAAIKEKREPNFEYLKNDLSTGIYDHVMPQKLTTTPMEAQAKRPPNSLISSNKSPRPFNVRPQEPKVQTPEPQVSEKVVETPQEPETPVVETPQQPEVTAETSTPFAGVQTEVSESTPFAGVQTEVPAQQPTEQGIHI